MVAYVGWIGLLLLALYEIVGIINPRVPTISQILWRLMENRWFRAAFTFMWFWLTIHLFWPEWFK